MNLRGFKKVTDERDHAILKNNNGHEIRIAKQGLSAKHLKDLESLSLHKEEGGDIEGALNQQQDVLNNARNAEDTEEDVPQETVPTQSRGIAQAAQPQPADTGDQSTDMASASGDSASMAPTAPGSSSGMGSQSEPDPMEAARQQKEQAYQQYFTQHAKELGEQDAKYAQDLSNGHIQPQTYSSLFAKKDTMGKIGTLFGLMVSGAGSGLSHQPNAVLQMMNNEINNDLEAQKQSKSNAQNFLKINQQANMNRANIGLLKTQTQGAALENEIKHQTMSKNQMMLTLLHGLKLSADKVPANSPLKGQYNQGLNQLGQLTGNEIQQNNLKAAAQMAGISQADYVSEMNQMRLAGNIGGEQSLVNEAKDRESKLIPNVGYADKQMPQEKIDRITGITNYQGRLNEYKQLADLMSSGLPISKWSPELRNKAEAIRSDLISGYNDVKGLKRFTGNEEELYNKIIPDIKKVDLANFFGGAKNNILNLQKSVQRIRDQELTSSGVHPFSDTKDVQSEIRYDSQGNAWKLGSNGKPVRAN